MDEMFHSLRVLHNIHREYTHIYVCNNQDILIEAKVEL